ncbi:MAG: VTT domain-containing protein [Dehalococcoidales bacterium]|nr:VTT domain-containing protein [Dehalococcoidales bacterium]
MPKKETVIGFLGLLVSIGLAAFALLYRDYLAGIANIGGYSLVGVFAVSFISASVVSVTFIPIPYYLPVLLLSDTLSSEWGILAPVFIGTVSATGASLGQLPTFMIGYGGKRISERLTSRSEARSYRRILEWVERHGSFAVFMVSAVPNPFHLPLTLALGALKFPTANWFIFTLLGNLFKNLVIAFIGYFALHAIL